MSTIQQSIRPRDIESPFDFHELFFSITDLKSNILYANDVFLRVSKYPQEEILGQLHKIIRHPDIPRAVFKIFWDLLKAQKPVAAYVKNLAKDGSYYWVMALAYPCREGYLSIRLKPGSPLFQKVQKLYKETLRYEQQMEQKLGKRKGMYESEQFLLQQLKEAGYESYEPFMWDALEKEMRHREAQLKRLGHHQSVFHQPIPEHMKNTQAELGKLFDRLENLDTLHDTLLEHSEYLLQLSRAILHLSINAEVSSAKLKTEDQSITVIAENMGKQTQEGEEKLLKILENVKALNKLLRTLNIDIISSKLQVEMINDFLVDVATGNHRSSFDQLISGEKAVELLYAGHIPTLRTVKEDVSKLPAYIRDLRSQLTGIDRFLLILRYIHTSGKIEASKMVNETGSFKNTFNNLITEVNAAQRRLDELSDAIAENEKTGTLFADSQRTLEKALESIEKGFIER